MPSNRIVIDTTKNLGARILDVMTDGALFREKLAELNNDVAAYNADVSFQTDTGMSASDQTKFTSLLANAVAEMSGLTNVQVVQGGQTNVRQLLDDLSRVG